MLRIAAVLLAAWLGSAGITAAGEMLVSRDMAVEGVKLAPEATIIRLSRTDQSLVQAAAARPAPEGQISLLLSGISAKRATSIGFDVAFLALDPSTGRTLHEAIVATIYIFDLRPTRRSIDILPSLHNALYASPSVLAISVRPEGQSAELSQVAREEIVQAGISIDRIEIIVRS
ncbi:hypothetical protein HAP48_0000430 (plasmid) [Bradyrhizobium septentrionale]|uniref:Uncharacterized protein n=1 Tax=Bradyrhizobium septentrionale TaxID=1404411 RepID=A0A973WA92_9BRAD|nr:hypothetical protein [Bradyrhizobium septentrionale]UGY11947.1 hypothetical protein HAP48_0000430 [Bradyrhizobium septentrionale]UGY30151.1 hypothetical protein HU675_0047835 [Bradyrhizobium septentrionale]